jgi:putative SOS response-associated peptidase YedK
VILGPDSWDRWLANGSGADRGELLAMLQPTDDIALRVYAVNRYVNDVRRDGPDLIEPLSPSAEGVRPGPVEETLGI